MAQRPSKPAFAFNRMEFSGSLGDLGTLLPLSLGMIMINGVNAVSIFFCIGIYYVFSGLYFRVTSPVEPMKIVAAYAIASGLTLSQIQASSILIGLTLLILGGTGIINQIGKRISLVVVRGVQLSTGTLLFIKGLHLIGGSSPFQKLQGMAEPHLTLQNLGGVPIGLIIGAAMTILTLFLLSNRKVPAAVTVVALGFIFGFLFRKPDALEGLTFQLSLPAILPYGLPTFDDLSFAIIFLVLPQLPMTIGNAVMANADLSSQYFPETGKKVTPKSLTLSMAAANIMAFFLGGIPMCHGAGGLASRYRFGARTAGSNIIIGGIFFGLALLFGNNLLKVVTLLPLSLLGVLLLFAGTQLALTMRDIRTREDLFVLIVMLGLTLTFNLAVGFLVGIALHTLIKSFKITI